MPEKDVYAWITIAVSMLMFNVFYYLIIYEKAEYFFCRFWLICRTNNYINVLVELIFVKKKCTKLFFVIHIGLLFSSVVPSLNCNSCARQQFALGREITACRCFVVFFKCFVVGLGQGSGSFIHAFRNVFWKMKFIKNTYFILCSCILSNILKWHFSQTPHTRKWDSSDEGWSDRSSCQLGKTILS